MGWKEKLKWIDPFTYVDKFVIPKVNPKNNEHVNWVIYIIFAFIFAWLIYSALGLAFGTASPMVIVMSGSMEPVFYRGDVIGLFGANAGNIQAPEVQLLDKATLKDTGFYEIAEPKYALTGTGIQIQSIKFKNSAEIPVQKTGTVIVYFSELTQQPIIHRAVAKLHAQDGYYLLTKGDSIYNNTIDQDCGRIFPMGPEKTCITLYPIPINEVQGRAAFSIPLIGCAKIWLFDNLTSLLLTGKLPTDFNGKC